MEEVRANKVASENPSCVLSPGFRGHNDKTTALLRTAEKSSGLAKSRSVSKVMRAGGLWGKKGLRWTAIKPSVFVAAASTIRVNLVSLTSSICSQLFLPIYDVTIGARPSHHFPSPQKQKKQDAFLFLLLQLSRDFSSFQPLLLSRKTGRRIWLQLYNWAKGSSSLWLRCPSCISAASIPLGQFIARTLLQPLITCSQCVCVCKKEKNTILLVSSTQTYDLRPHGS